MAPLLLATLVTLSWFVPTTRAIVCDAGRRYVHPHNCSAFIMCNKYRSPEIFKCPTGLHYNAMKSYCDWPENAKCRLEEKKTAFVISRRNITAMRNDRVTKTEQKIKANDKIQNVTFTYKDAVVQKGKAENETSVFERGVLNRSQPKEHHLNEAKKDVKGGVVKAKTTNEGAKEVVEKSAVKGKTKDINDLGAVANSGPSENKGKLEVKSGKGKTEVEVSTQEKKPERDSEVNKPVLFRKAFHSISKRQDKTEAIQEETKKKSEKKDEEKNSMENNKTLSKPVEIEDEKSNVTEVKNSTLDEGFSYKEKELYFSNKSLIGFDENKNDTGYNLNSKEVSEEPVTNNGSDVIYSTVLFKVNFTDDIFGYDVISGDTTNSTGSSSAVESPTTNENVPIIENPSTSESSPASKGTSKSESVPTSKIIPSSTSEPSV